MNKKKTLIIVIASALVVIIGIVAVVLALRGKDKNEVVDATTTTESVGETTTIDSTLEPTLEVIGTSPNKETENDAPTDAPTDANKETEKETEPSDEGEKETEPVTDPVVEGTLAPTVAPTIPPTVAPTEPQTPAPTVPPTEPPTEAPKPLTDEEKLKAMGVTYEANAEGGVTITGGNLTGDVVIPATIDGKEVTVGYIAFDNTSGITSLVINCKTIDDFAFGRIDTLKTVVIGADVEVLGAGAFDGCKNLESVTFLGEKITEIPNGLFGGCLKLLSLTLPRSVNKVYAGSLCATAGEYAMATYPGAFPPDSEWGPIVPAFTLYVYREPDLIYEDFIIYREYGSLEEALAEYRMYNYTIVYK